MNLEQVSQIFYKIKLIEKKLNKSFEENAGISLTRYEILMTLLRNGDFSQSELQNYLKIDNAAITRHLKKLEDGGYIIRNKNTKNGRELIVSLTEKSHIELNKCRKSCASFTKSIKNEFSKEDIEQLLNLLNKFENNIRRNYASNK